MVEPDPSTLNGFASVMREKLVDVPREIVAVADRSASRIMPLILLFSSAEENDTPAEEDSFCCGVVWNPWSVGIAVESSARRILSLTVSFTSAEKTCIGDDDTPGTSMSDWPGHVVEPDEETLSVATIHTMKRDARSTITKHVR